MLKLFALLLCVSVAVRCEDGNLWAVLVAGSNGWDNYRHQADVYHAYQILHKHGIPDERIIVFHYDDIAHNQENPTPGKVINRPGGEDVYHNVPKDYVGDAVTPQTFLKVLRGESEGLKEIGSGKVLKSGPNDHVFVNFADHGGTGILAFPNDLLSVQDLIATIKTMHKKMMYKKLVWYVEACESGSMFDGVLPTDINVFATTASNPDESSWGYYCDVPNMPCLGDLYSINWMEDSDKEDIETETLQKQFEVVRQETNLSHVMEYGDLTIAQLVVGDFQGKTAAGPTNFPKIKRTANMAMATHDIPVQKLRLRLQRTNSLVEQAKLKNKIQRITAKRSLVEAVVNRIVHEAARDIPQARRILATHNKITDVACHDVAVKTFSRYCFNFGKNPFASKFAFVLNNLCVENLDASHISATIRRVCMEDREEGIH